MQKFKFGNPLTFVEVSKSPLDRAFATMEDKVVCKLRRGLKISFYVA